MPRIQIVRVHTEEKSEEEILNMPLREFFSFERMCLFDPDNFACARHVWLRIAGTDRWTYKKTPISHGETPSKTVGELLKHVTRQDLLNIDRVAQESVDLMERMLEYSGFHLKLTR